MTATVNANLIIFFTIFIINTIARIAMTMVIKSVILNLTSYYWDRMVLPYFAKSDTIISYLYSNDKSLAAI